MPFDADELLFPNCWEILDHIHIIMNALQAGVERLSWWESFKEGLMCVVEVFGTNYHRDRFLMYCEVPSGMAAAFKRFKMRLISWRWEVLEIILDDCVDGWAFMAYFDLGKMMGPNKLSRALYEALIPFLGSQHHERAFVCVFRLFVLRGRSWSSIRNKSTTWSPSLSTRAPRESASHVSATIAQHVFAPATPGSSAPE